ncbi:MAG: transposase [Stigonema ocellatum SAG 48.90 = DSM 106950]|nr:transposase [Stigonema ocellatum SAG 48.90 = DSM 106950]
MQVRWNFKLLPNQSQEATLEDWLVTLRKHRNYALRERIDGFQDNNQDVEVQIHYAFGAYCFRDSRIEYGTCCPLTCSVVKHGVVPQDFKLAFKNSKIKDKKTGEVIGTAFKWDSASGIQMKVTTQLRNSRSNFSIVDSDVLQGNIAKLDTAFANFWKNNRGFPQFKTRLDSFEYKPGQVKMRHIRNSYATSYLPGIGFVKFHNSRELSLIQKIKTTTVKREGENWYISMLVEIPGELQAVKPLEDCLSVVGIDVGVNKLVALSDGSFQENSYVATNKKTARRIAMRQRAISRKQKGSKNRTKAIKKLRLQQHKIAQQRDGYNWQVASIIVKTADVVAREDLRIKNMVKRAKPKQDGETALFAFGVSPWEKEGNPPQATANPKGKGGYKRNGASQKTGLNKVILDTGWGDIFNKIAWLALKAGKPVISVPAKYSSQECPKCSHIDKNNREGEKFLCVNCKHMDHADTKASRTLALRAGLVFPKNKKTLPADCGKVTPSRYQPIVVETLVPSLWESPSCAGNSDSRICRRYG